MLRKPQQIISFLAIRLGGEALRNRVRPATIAFGFGHGLTHGKVDLKVPQHDIGKDPQCDSEQKRSIAEWRAGGVAAFVVLVDQVETAQDSEGDEVHRQVEMTRTELRFDLGPTRRESCS